MLALSDYLGNTYPSPSAKAGENKTHKSFMIQKKKHGHMTHSDINDIIPN